MSCAGLLLAAGGGTRMGTAKALVDDPGGGSFVERGVRVLREGGCAPVVVVVGAEAERASLLASAAGADEVVEVVDWACGQSASLRAGLEALATTQAYAVCILLVDLPDVGPDVVDRVVRAAGDGPSPNGPSPDGPSPDGPSPDGPSPDRPAGGAPTVLARAAYRGTPGHPVVIGRDHWGAVLDAAHGDHGARGYLAGHPHTLVECGDLASGRDVDTPADLA